MGAILNLMKEVPLTAIVKERLAAAEQEIVTLKRENSILKEENSILKSKVQNLEILRNHPNHYDVAGIDLG
jgi:transposase-like protein